MENIIALPDELMTALSVIVVGAVIPGLTAILKQPSTPAWVRRVLPIVLAAFGAVIIVILQGGGTWADRITTWAAVAAAIVGIAQALYVALRKALGKLEGATSPRGRRAYLDEDGDGLDDTTGQPQP